MIALASKSALNFSSISSYPPAYPTLVSQAAYQAGIKFEGSDYFNYKGQKYLKGVKFTISSPGLEDTKFSIKSNPGFLPGTTSVTLQPDKRQKISLNMGFAVTLIKAGSTSDSISSSIVTFSSDEVNKDIGSVKTLDAGIPGGEWYIYHTDPAD